MTPHATSPLPRPGGGEGVWGVPGEPKRRPFLQNRPIQNNGFGTSPPEQTDPGGGVALPVVPTYPPHAQVYMRRPYVLKTQTPSNYYYYEYYY